MLFYTRPGFFAQYNTGYNLLNACYMSDIFEVLPELNPLYEGVAMRTKLYAWEKLVTERGVTWANFIARN